MEIYDSILSNKPEVEADVDRLMWEHYQSLESGLMSTDGHEEVERLH